jgi:hypothetical protein
MDLDGCVDLSFFTLLAEAARYGTLCKFLADLAVFALLEGFALLSIQPPPETVHTRLFLMVALTFCSSSHSGHPIRYALQVLADLAVFALLEGFPFLSSPLHPAAARHGTHPMDLDGRVDLSFFTLLLPIALLPQPFCYFVTCFLLFSSYPASQLINVNQVSLFGAFITHFFHLV